MQILFIFSTKSTRLFLFILLFPNFGPFLSQPSKLTQTKGVHHCCSAGYSEGKSRYDDLLDANYQRDVPPTTESLKFNKKFNSTNQKPGPVQVTVSLVFLNLALSQTAEQILHADVFYYMEWADDRLKIDKVLKLNSHKNNSNKTQNEGHLKNVENQKIILDHCWADRLWVPDTFFRNAINGEVSDVLRPTCYFTVTRKPANKLLHTSSTTSINTSYPNLQTNQQTTTVFMAVRLLLKLTCSMNFAKFPFDVQKCHVNVTATKEGAETMVLRWGRFSSGSHVDRTEFRITGQAMLEEDYKYFPHINARLSTISGQLTFERQTAKYVLKRFIPSFIVVVIAFTGFWIPTPLAPARVTLAVTCLLALVTQQIQADLSVSYVYSLQVWNMVAISYVFAALCEYSLALYVMHMAVKRRSFCYEKPEKNCKLEERENGGGGDGEEGEDEFQIHKKVKNLKQAKRVHKMPITNCSDDDSAYYNNKNYQFCSCNHHHSCHHHQKQINQSIESFEMKTFTAEMNKNSNIKNLANISSNCKTNSNCHYLWKHFRTTSRHSAVDNVSRFLFPLSYFLFVLVFIVHAKSDQQTAFIFL